MSDIQIDGSQRSNSLPLDSETADKLRGFIGNGKVARIDLSLLALELKERNIDDKNNYTKGFKKWYAKENLNKLLGDTSRFSKLALTGEMINYVNAKSNAERYINKLPPSGGALYEAAKIFKHSEKLFDACFVSVLERKSILDDENSCKKDNTKAVINEFATEAAIRNWFDNWKNPKEKEDNTERRTIKVLTLYCSKDLYSFDENDEETSDFDISRVKVLIDQINEIVSGDEKIYRLQDELGILDKNYIAKKEKAHEKATAKVDEKMNAKTTKKLLK